MINFIKLQDYNDLLSKCEFEYKLLFAKQKINYDYSYILFNLVCTLNHLYEWFLKDNNVKKPDKYKCINIFNYYTPNQIKEIKNNIKKKDIISKLYKNLTSMPKVNKNQLIVRELCNKAKHFSKKPKIDNKEEFIAFCGGEKAVCDYMFANQSEIVYFVVYNNQEFIIENICFELINKWKDFLNN